MSDVAVFAPSPVLTVTVEDHPNGPDVHVHAGGQGVWQARMLRRLGVRVTLCSALTGELGRTLRHLLDEEGFNVSAVERDGRGAAYVHDRRSGERSTLIDAIGDPLGRHELDELFGIMLHESLAAGVAILSGPHGDLPIDPDVYRRLAADLSRAGVAVVVDLAGERMEAALSGGVRVLKVSDEELRADGRLEGDSPAAVMQAMRELRASGAETVIVSRAEQPLLLLDADGFLEASAPRLEVADHRGAGDSLTAGITAGIARGESPRTAITMAAAAAALNVTRHGLGTGDLEAITRLRDEVIVRHLREETDGGDDQSAPAEQTAESVDQPVTPRVSPDGLAALAHTDDDAEETA